MLQSNKSNEESLNVQIISESSSKDNQTLETVTIQDALVTRQLKRKIDESDYDFMLTPKKAKCYFKKISYNMLARTPQIREKKIQEIRRKKVFDGV